MNEKRETEWKAGENTHENVVYACFGGMSNTGITAVKPMMDYISEEDVRKAKELIVKAIIGE